MLSWEHSKAASFKEDPPFEEGQTYTIIIRQQPAGTDAVSYMAPDGKVVRTVDIGLVAAVRQKGNALFLCDKLDNVIHTFDLKAGLKIARTPLTPPWDTRSTPAALEGETYIHRVIRLKNKPAYLSQLFFQAYRKGQNGYEIPVNLAIPLSFNVLYKWTYKKRPLRFD